MISHIDNFILRKERTSKIKRRWYNAVMNAKEIVKKIGEVFLKYVLGPAVAIVIALTTSIKSDSKTVGYLEASISDINQRIDDVNASNDKRFARLESDIDRIDRNMSDVMSSINELNHNLGIAEGKISAIPLQSTGDLTENIMQMSYQKNEDVYYSSLNLGDGIVAVGIDSTEYTAEDLQNQPIIIAYQENGQDVFFMGQFDENNQWDGECLINVYKDGQFVIATEALYDSGKRIEYEQLFPDNGRWIYSKREDRDEFNGGDTWTYELAGTVKQQISSDSPKAEDMIRPSDIEDAIDKVRLSHYHGNTSDGKYNDDTGNAYLIEYYDDGYTRLLYQGRFSDGLQDDGTGDAWQIAKGADTDYMLYKGIFQSGQQAQSQNDAKEWENPVQESTIEEYTKGKPYESELNWDMSHITQ